jgi:F0F1-type ATP synthase membrane subunit c/vacuolar-type H+-ATPase subunit K
MNMRNVIIITIAIIISLLLTIGYSSEGQSMAQSNMLNKALSIVGLGFAAGAGALGIGLLSRSFIEGIYRNPETTNKMLIWFFVAFALIEAQVLYTLFFVFQLFFAK